MERLQKVIASCGYCSRRKAEEYIKEGKVFVNDKQIKDLGVKVSFEDKIVVNKQLLKLKEDKEYYLLYKPKKVISAVSDDKKRMTVVDLIKSNVRIYPVGRLDYNTTGLLLVTNDGELTNKLTHPTNHVEKIYQAKIEGILTAEEFMKIKKGIIIEGQKVGVTYLKIKNKNINKNSSTVIIGIVEGRNHIIKKLFKQLGHEVKELKRETLAFLNLDGLKIGEYRKLTIKEVKKLYALK